MTDQKTFLDAIQEGDTILFEAFLGQKSSDDPAIGQGILIALDMGNVDAFCALVDLYEGSLADLDNAQGYTFFNRITDSFSRVAQNHVRDSENYLKQIKDKQEQLQAKLIEIIEEKELLEQKDKFGVTLSQYLRCSYQVPFIAELLGKEITNSSRLINDVAGELQVELESGDKRSPIEIHKIKKFIEKNTKDKWKAYLTDLKISLNDTEYHIFLSKIEQESKVQDSLRDFKDVLKESLVGPKRDEFFQPINSFFDQFLDYLNANNDEYYKILQGEILSIIAIFLTKHHETPIDDYIELFKTAPETAYIYKLYGCWETILAKGPYHPNVLKMAFKLYFSQGKRDNTKLESFEYYISEAKAYCQMEQDLNNTLSLNQIGKKGKAIKHAYQELMLDVVKDNTPFEEFKRNLTDAYAKKTTRPTEESKSDLTETNTKKINPSAASTQGISRLEKFINLLKRWWYGDQKSKLDSFFDNLNKNRSWVFKKEYTNSMLKAQSIFKEPETTGTLTPTDGPKVP